MTSGLAIYDTMQFVKPDVNTYCVGQASSMGAVLLAARQARQAVCSSACPHNDTSAVGRRSGTGDGYKHTGDRDIEDARKIEEILAKHTKQPLEKIKKDTDRDFFMSAEEAKAYGIVDEVD